MDFKSLRDTTPIADVAAMLGLKLTENKDQLVGFCPITGGGNSTVFKITPGRNRWICFCPSCKKEDKQGGDCIELVKRVRKVEYLQAATLIAEHFGKQEKPEPKEEKRTFDPLAYQAKLQADHPALQGLRISAETLKEFGGGYCGKGVHYGRLTLPIHKRCSLIEAFLSVPLYQKADEPLQDAVRYFKGYEPPLLFNMHGPKDRLVIRPSIMEVLESWEGGIEDAVCALQPMNAEFLRKLATFCDENDIKEIEIY